jgi:hypothetical protein
LGKAASEDLLLKNHAAELQAQAVILVYQVKSRIYRTLNVKEVSDESGIKNEEEARTRIEESLKKEGFHLEPGAEAKIFKVIGQSKDAKAKIVTKTIDLVKRTNNLYLNYQ